MIALLVLFIIFYWYRHVLVVLHLPAFHPAYEESYLITSSFWASINHFLQINNCPGGLLIAWDVLFEDNVLMSEVSVSVTQFLPGQGFSKWSTLPCTHSKAHKTTCCLFSWANLSVWLYNFCLHNYSLHSKEIIPFALKPFDESLSAFRNIVTGEKEKE